MKRFIKLTSIIVLLFAFNFNLMGQDNVIRFSSLDWPPYTGQRLILQGANVVVVKAAFKAMGYELQVDFFPWARAVKLAKDKKYLGYFPEYYAKSIEAEFIFSDPIGTSPLGFVERKDNPISWQSVQDLKKIEKIGVVNGYVNEEKFDELVASGEIRAEVVSSDLTNIRKVYAKRIPTAVVDKNVMEFLIKSNDLLSRNAGLLQFNSKLLDNKLLYLCFQKSEQGRKFIKIFNEGLKKIDVKKLTQAYFKEVLK